jgi:uncharacterized membrane protein
LFDRLLTLFAACRRPQAFTTRWRSPWPPFDAEIAKPRSKSFDRALSLIAAFIVVAIIMVARY